MNQPTEEQQRIIARLALLKQGLQLPDPLPLFLGQYVGAIIQVLGEEAANEVIDLAEVQFLERQLED